MLKLYRLSESQADAAALVGIDDIERRQHVQQLTHKVLAGCKQAGQPFTWIRAAGLRSIGAAIAVGLENGQALTAVLEATYSQVLEVILSTLDRDLINTHPAQATIAAAAGQEYSSSSSSQVSELLAAVGRYPAGYAPAAASSEELQEAFKVLQVLCLLHPKARNVLCKAQYLQLVTARACEAPACLPSAMNTLLTLLQGKEEAQGLFVTTGGLDMLLTRTLQHVRQQHTPSPTAAAVGNTAISSSSSGGDDAGGGNVLMSDDLVVEGAGLTRRELAVQLLLFLQLLEHWVIAEAVAAGAHPSSQGAVLGLIVSHLGPDVAATLKQEVPLCAQLQQHDSRTDGSAAAPQQQQQQPWEHATAAAATSTAAGWLHSPERVLHQRAEAAADKLLRHLQ